MMSKQVFEVGQRVLCTREYRKAPGEVVGVNTSNETYPIAYITDANGDRV